MKKSELIKLLSQLPDDAEILLFHETYSGIDIEHEDEFVVMIHNSLYTEEVLLVPNMYTYLFDNYVDISEIV